MVVATQRTGNQPVPQEKSMLRLEVQQPASCLVFLNVVIGCLIVFHSVIVCIVLRGCGRLDRFYNLFCLILESGWRTLVNDSVFSEQLVGVCTKFANKTTVYHATLPRNEGVYANFPCSVNSTGDVALTRNNV